MALRRKNRRNCPATRLVILPAILTSLIVAASLWVIGYAAAMALRIEAVQELIRDHLTLPPAPLADGVDLGEIPLLGNLQRGGVGHPTICVDPAAIHGVAAATARTVVPAFHQDVLRIIHNLLTGPHLGQ